MADILEELVALEAEVDELLPTSFTDSTGAERSYPAGLTVGERDEYEAWAEGVIAANAHNHERPIALTSKVNYDAL